MRIIYLHQYFNTPEMSGGTRSYEMARRLVANGHEVHIITSWRELGERADGEWFKTEEAGIRVHWLPVPYNNAMSYRERIQAFFRFAWQAARKAASLPADVIFATSTPLTIAIPAAYAKWRHNIPMVFEVRDLWPDVPAAMGVLKNRTLLKAAKRLELFAYKSANHIIALTPTMRDFISGKGVPLEKISTIPNISNPESFPSHSNTTSSDQKNLLYCGNLGPAHGPEYLVELAKEFRRQNIAIHITVIGDGKLRESMEADAAQAGSLNETIRFQGKVPKGDVPKFYTECDASIMTICDCELLYRHSVQNKFFDSLAAGKPVFANYSGWASELAEREGVGLIIDRENPEQAALRIADFMGDSEKLQKSQNAARELAESQFHANKLVDDLEAILLRVTRDSDKSVAAAPK
ncbi:glycosyltransferase WbuB [Gammaproteobacteria bacterium 2W06]|nr:glycosyltransferase WbuB [Gammaproteobacteria bacterium 2W06]